MIEHCISTFTKDQEETFYRVYITDALKAIVENTSRFNGGVTMTKRYADAITHKRESTPEENEQKASEIIDRIKSKLRNLK